MKVYLVRQPDGTLWMCTAKPVRNHYGRWGITDMKASMVRLPSWMFPEVKEEDEDPSEYEIPKINKYADRTRRR